MCFPLTCVPCECAVQSCRASSCVRCPWSPQPRRGATAYMTMLIITHTTYTETYASISIGTHVDLYAAVGVYRYGSMSAHETRLLVWWCLLCWSRWDAIRKAAKAYSAKAANRRSSYKVRNQREAGPQRTTTHSQTAPFETWTIWSCFIRLDRGRGKGHFSSSSDLFCTFFSCFPIVCAAPQALRPGALDVRAATSPQSSNMYPEPRL